MKEKHIVLRKVVGRIERGAPAVPAGVSRDDISVQVAELESRDVPTLSRARDVVAVAPAMPMHLVQPRDVHTAPSALQDDIAWGVQAVKADTSPFTGAGITVAVLDTGVDGSHSAFAGVDLVQKNFTQEADEDLHGHGTHCAATIFGRRTGGLRIGVAPGVSRALIGKVLGRGGGSSEQIVTAIQWACEEGAHIISMSLGMDFPGFVDRLAKEGLPVELATSRALEGYRANVLLFERLAALVRVRPRATLLVAAAGNESRRDIDSRFEIAVSPPAVSEGFISVAALGQGKDGLAVASFSNTGASLSAPGVDIVSAGLGAALVAMSGTSMAAPHVAGVAALWAERNLRMGPLSGTQLAAQLVGNATINGLRANFQPPSVGAGIVQAPQA